MPIFNLVPCGRCGKRLHYVYLPAMTFTRSFWSCLGCGHRITIWEMDRKMEVERLALNKDAFHHVPKLRGNLVSEDFLTADIKMPALAEEDDDARDLSDLFPA